MSLLNKEFLQGALELATNLVNKSTAFASKTAFTFQISLKCMFIFVKNIFSTITFNFNSLERVEASEKKKPYFQNKLVKGNRVTEDHNSFRNSRYSTANFAHLIRGWKKNMHDLGRS